MLCPPSGLTSTTRPSLPSTTQRLAVPGGTIAFDDAGRGPVVIGVPSIGVVRAEYRFLRPQPVSAGSAAWAASGPGLWW
jgi:hypothetical protein